MNHAGVEKFFHLVRANSGQALKDVQSLLAIGSVIIDNLLSRIHRSTVLQMEKLLR